MDPREVNDIESAREIIEQRNLNHVKIGVFDIDGILRGKYLSKDKFFSALTKGLGFCDVILGWDSHDQLYDNIRVTGWHTGYPDSQLRILPETCREIPWEENMLLFLGEFQGHHESICPRFVLRQTLARAESMGFNVFAGFEYEFFVFKETPESIRQKKYQNLTPLQPGYFGYSMLRDTVESEFYHELLDIYALLILDNPILICCCFDVNNLFSNKLFINT